MRLDNSRPLHAKYVMTWFDFNWNELGTTPNPISAHDLVAKIEEWNRKCQLEARCDPASVVDETLPCAISIGVRYVER